MRMAILLLTVMGALVVGSGVAFAAVITCPTGPGDECRGTQMADEITGTIGVDQIYALDGDDSVQSGGLGQRLQSLHLPPVLGVVVEAISAADRFASNILGLHSEARGDDLIKGGLGADKMYGGDGNDKMGGWTGNDTFYGGASNDRLSGGDGGDEIHGEEGDDIDLDGDAAIDKIYGEEGNDFELDGDSGNDLIYGGPGDDGGAPTSENLQHHGLRGEGGENQVYGNEGADTIDAQTTLLSALAYCVHRGRFACVVDLAGAREEIFGGDGDDTITAADGVKDVINCGAGLDRVVSYDRGLDVLE